MWKLIDTLGELFHWLRVRAELQARRELHQEIERVDAETDELEFNIATARQHGMPELADRLLARRTDTIRYRAGLPAIESGGDIHSSEGHDAGNRVSDPVKGPANP